MDNETQEVTREDVLILTLYQDLASWCGVKPVEYQKYINQLLPWEEGENIIAALRPVDLECQCLLLAIDRHINKKKEKLDMYSLTMLYQIYTALRTGGYTHACRIKNAGATSVLFLSIKRIRNQAWWCEVEPDATTKLLETLKSLM